MYMYKHCLEGGLYPMHQCAAMRYNEYNDILMQNYACQVTDAAPKPGGCEMNFNTEVGIVHEKC